jgi:hypothetical protein
VVSSAIALLLTLSGYGWSRAVVLQTGGWGGGGGAFTRPSEGFHKCLARLCHEIASQTKDLKSPVQRMCGGDVF